MQSVELILERVSTNRIGKEAIAKQIKEITDCCKNRAQAAGVEGLASDVIGPVEFTDEIGKRYRYTFRLLLKKEKYRSETAAMKCIENAKRFTQRAAESRSWVVKGDTQEQANREAAAEMRPPMAWEPLSDEIYEEYFDGIYEREPHIRLIHRSTFTFVETHGDERNHTLLYGEPAACKSELFKRFKRWYDDDCERVAVINSTTLSKAGLENWLLEKAKDGLLPEVIWFDEIEKFSNETDLSCLLGVMDGQGVITKLNAKVGKQEARARVLVWGTCNNEEKLKKWNAGALWSRFSKKLECVRPSRDLMHKILLQKIAERRRLGRKADDRWAEAAIEYAFDVAKTNDPRAILGYLDGTDALLDGSYFADIEAIKYMAESAAKAKVLGKF